MKQLIDKAAAAVANCRPLWAVVESSRRFGSRVYNYLGYQRAVKDRARFAGLFTDHMVKHGPFAGMKYLPMNELGGCAFPKLLGSFESEIGPLVDELCTRDYSAIVNIGCAEGYYAVGFARRMPNTRVYAYDTSAEPRRLCAKMADLNGVKVEIGGFCSEETLRGLELGAKALIVSDCEGYEAVLFKRPLVEALRRHDFLIEAHDSGDITTSAQMRSAFAETHTIREFQSVDDIQKAYTYNFAELEGMSLADRRLIVAEGRATIMRWFFMEAKPGAA